MTLNEAQLEGFLISEDLALKYEKQIIGAYLQANTEIDTLLSKAYADMSGLTGDGRVLHYLSYGRRDKLQSEIKKIYTKYDLKAQSFTVKAGTTAITENYNRQMYINQWVSDVGYVALNPKLIDYAVTGQLEAWREIQIGSPADWQPSGGTLSSIIKKNREEALQKIRVAINSGILSGNGYRPVSKSVKDIIGYVEKGASGGQVAKALRIARTEGTRLLNAGAYAQSLEADAQGIEMRKRWDATLDIRTRPEHGAADGQEQPIDKPFLVAGEELMYPGDSRGSAGNIINCRCAYVSLPAGTSTQLRRARNPATGQTEVIDYTFYPEWAKLNGV